MKGNRFFLIGLILLALAVVFAGCGGGGGGSNGGGGGGGVAPATAEQASGAGQATNLASGSYETFSNLGQIGLTATGNAPAVKLPAHLNKDAGLKLTSKISSNILASKAAKQATSAIKAARSKASSVDGVNWTCDDGGTFVLTETVPNVSYSIVFNQCREADEQYNGTYTITVTQTGFTVDLGAVGNPLTILSFDNNYTTLVASLEAVLTLGLSMPNATTYSMTGNGDISAKDYLSGNDYAMSYSNFEETFSMTQSGNDFLLSLVTNGSFSETWTEAGTPYGVDVSFSSLGFDMTMFANGDDSTEVSGSTTVSFTNNYCTGGTFAFVTDVPVYWTDSVGHTTAGKITINGGAIVIVWNSSGTVTVTDSTGSTTYANEYAMFETCDFAVIGEDAPPSSGTSGTVTGATMTVTSKSQDSAGGLLDCYTDIHVNYYNTLSPTATTMGTWYIDWHQMDASNPDINGDGIPDFEQYLDIDFDGYADVGLDINGADWDSAAGGLEHFYATKLPEGYYVISMNNWSCPITVSNTVTISVGSSVFGPYNCSYTTYDYEGDGSGLWDSGAWCAVADVVATTSGVTVQAHNPDLELWHDGALGLFAPRPAKTARLR